VRDSDTVPLISVVIPTLNEEGYLPSTLASVQGARGLELIVVDGGSTDDTVRIARSSGAFVVHSEPGRARQMNEGARVARGSMLLFLHADTRVPRGFAERVRRTLADESVAAGAFGLRIEGPRWSLRVVERLVRWRCRWFGLPYGDQALFMRAPTFHGAGGYPQQPIMEDFDLVRRLRRLGRIQVVSEMVETSGRRWLKRGVGRVTLLNQVIILAYVLGVGPERLARWRR